MAGLVWALAFPKFGIAGLAWIAPGLLLFAARDQKGKRAFGLGYVGGLVYWLVSLYWLLLIPYRWHGIPFGPALGWVALSGFLALYAGLWTWLVTQLRSPVSSWRTRAVWALQCALVWVAIEMIRARLLSGFPWNPLGASQYRLTPLLQMAAFLGVYGVSFLVVWFSVSLLNALTLLIREPVKRRLWLAEIIVPAVAVAGIWYWGFQRIMAPEPEPKTLRLALVQPSIPQEVIWDSEANPRRFEKLMKLSEAALLEKPDVLVWPEASMPGLTEENISALTKLVAAHRVWFVFGADDAEAVGGEMKYFNSSFLLSPEGKLVSTYRKRLLVMFGEYVPLVRWFPFLKFLTPVDGGFTPGEKPTPFRLDDLEATTSVLICFEDVFPHYAREHVAADTDFLLNLTNDGWFGNSAAQWQQAITALFRAVENGVPLVRCTNNGLTCWIDRFGRMRQVFGVESGNVYQEGFMLASIPIQDRSGRPTLYTRYGDWFGWGCVVFALGALVMVKVRRT